MSPLHVGFFTNTQQRKANERDTNCVAFMNTGTYLKFLNFTNVACYRKLNRDRSVTTPMSAR